MRSYLSIAQYLVLSDTVPITFYSMFIDRNYKTEIIQLIRKVLLNTCMELVSAEACKLRVLLVRLWFCAFAALAFAIVAVVLISSINTAPT